MNKCWCLGAVAILLPWEPHGDLHDVALVLSPDETDEEMLLKC